MEIRVAVYEDPDRAGLKIGEQRWIARSLSYDFIGESQTEQGALRNLFQAIAEELRSAAVEKRRPFEGLPHTPRAFIEWCERGTRKHLDVPADIERVLPEAWMIDAILRQNEARVG